MAVAKSYMDLPQTCEPFSENGKMYVKVLSKNKVEKKVRWYTDAQFAKMYPDSVEVVFDRKDPHFRTQKDVLGFSKGYVTIFKGNTFPHLDWFRSSICRYTRWWGWYITSEEEIPEDLPEDLTPVKLDWDPMSEDGESLISNEEKIREYVESVQFDPSPSEFVGEIKQRLDLELFVTRAITLESNYGCSTMHIFEDSKNNVFVWTTSAKTLQEGKTYKMRGTVKDHKVYRNTKQTILTRCAIQQEV